MALFSSRVTVSQLQREAGGTLDLPLPIDPLPKLDIASPPEIDPLSLPALRQAALMFMHESHVKRACYARLLEECQDRPAALDYYALADLGLAAKRPQDRFHRLTPQGVRAAKALEQALCQRLGIHLLMTTSRDRNTTTFKCPCGGWRKTILRTAMTQGKAEMSFARHVDQEAIKREAIREEAREIEASA